MLCQPTPLPQLLSHPEARFPGGHNQPNMPRKTGYGKGDISTLLGRGHFYFALTSLSLSLTGIRARGKFVQTEIRFVHLAEFLVRATTVMTAEPPG
jgi:hypothetical protein